VKAPIASVELSEQTVGFIQKIRTLDLFKLPGVAETIDWAHALTQLDVLALDADVIGDTVGALLKYQDDIAKVRGSEAARMLDEIKAALESDRQVG